MIQSSDSIRRIQMEKIISNLYALSQELDHCVCILLGGKEEI